jgi:hypothetical protein
MFPWDGDNKECKAGKETPPISHLWDMIDLATLWVHLDSETFYICKHAARDGAIHLNMCLVAYLLRALDC